MSLPSGRIRITGDGTPAGTRVTVDGVDISTEVQAVSIDLDCRGIGTATLTIVCPQVEYDGVVETWVSQTGRESAGAEIVTNLVVNGSILARAVNDWNGKGGAL